MTPVSATPTHMLRICVNPSFNFFCRLAATGANIASEPSHYSITTATGSKRPRADSDSLLCHVGLWRTSRFELGCGHREVCALTEQNLYIFCLLSVTRVLPCRGRRYPRLGDAGQRSALLNSPTTRYSMGIYTYAQHVRRRKI